MKKDTNKITLRVLSILHVFNDGFQESLVLLLPFIAKGMELSLSQVGALNSAMKFLAVFLAVPAGVIASRYGTLKTIVFGVFIYAVGFIGTGISSYIWQIFLFFFIVGFSFGIFHPLALGYLGRVTDKSNRGRVIGEFTAVGDIGRIGLSVFVTIFAATVGWRVVSIGYGLLGLVLFIATVLILTRFKVKDVSIEKHENEEHVNYSRFLKEKNVILTGLTGLLDAIGGSAIFVFLPFLLLDRGIDELYLGMFLGLLFIGNLVGKTFLGRFNDKYGYKKVLFASEIIMAIVLFMTTLTPNPVLLGILSFILGVVTKGTIPVINALRTDSIDHLKNYEKGFGIFMLFDSGGTLIASIIIGIIGDIYGIDATFYFMALITLTALIPAFFFVAVDND